MVWEGSQNVGHFRPHVQAPTVENVVGAHHAYCRLLINFLSLMDLLQNLWRDASLDLLSLETKPV
jgi:hypothetical protein